MSRYNKTIVASLFALAITIWQGVESLLLEGDWTREDTFVTVGLVLNAVAVWAVKNTSTDPIVQRNESVAG